MFVYPVRPELVVIVCVRAIVPAMRDKVATTFPAPTSATVIRLRPILAPVIYRQPARRAAAAMWIVSNVPAISPFHAKQAVIAIRTAPILAPVTVPAPAMVDVPVIRIAPAGPVPAIHPMHVRPIAHVIATAPRRRDALATPLITVMPTVSLAILNAPVFVMQLSRVKGIVPAI